MPRDAQLVAALDTDPAHGQGGEVSALLSRFLGADVAVSRADARLKAALGLDQADRLAPLLGNQLVAARTADGLLVSWVVKDERALRPVALQLRRRYRVVTRGPLLLAGGPTAVQHAIAQRAGMTPGLFAARLHGLPADALLRVEGSGALPRVSLPIARAVTSYAATLRADDSGFHARLRAATAPLGPDDLPLAPGATPPAPLVRSNGATLGIRDLRQVVRYALRRLAQTDRGTYRRYDLARRALKLIGRGDINGDVIDQLTGTATVWSPDLRTITITAPVPDPQRMAGALSGLRPLVSRLLDAIGLPGARFGVGRGSLVVTTDPATPLATLAAGAPQRIAGLSGALTGVVRGQALGQALIDRLGLPAIASLALTTLGDTTFAVRTATTGVEASADMTIRK